MKTYLVTGGAGFIGANFVKYILKKHNDIKVIILDKLTYAGNLITIESDIKDERVEFIKGDICDYKVVSEIFDRYDIDYVVNFAAESHVDRSIENPQLFLETNILGTQNLMEIAKERWSIGRDESGYPIYKQGKKFHQVSTDEVYGSLSKDYEESKNIELEDSLKKVVENRKSIKVYGEGFFVETTPLEPRSPYSASKTSADMLVIAYGETYKFPFTITRCSNNYGPYHFPEKLIPLTIMKILRGEKIPVYGDGKNVRDWLYVEDHCKGIDMVIESDKIQEIYNIGGFNEEQNIGIVKLIIDTVKKLLLANGKYVEKLKVDIEKIDYLLIEYVQDRLGHDRRYAINPKKIVEEIGWYPETTFDIGIEKTVKWYLENQEWVKAVEIN